jgi:hypothetical protein
MASAEKALQMSEDEIREWVKAGKGRKVTFYRQGYYEAIWRGRSGDVLYTVGDERRAFTSREQQSLKRVLALRTENEIRAWVQDPSASEESRSARFAETRGMIRIPEGAEDPPR